MDAYELLTEWYKVKDDEDLRKVNAFLWQHPQDMIQLIEEQAKRIEWLGDKVVELIQESLDLKTKNSTVDEQYSGA